jgi:hypothetical protein
MDESRNPSETKTCAIVRVFGARVTRNRVAAMLVLRDSLAFLVSIPPNTKYLVIPNAGHPPKQGVTCLRSRSG